METVARELLERVPWSQMRRISGLPTLMVRTLSGSRAIDGFVDDDRLFLVVVRPGPGAVVALRPPRPMRGAFVLAEQPRERLPVAFDGPAGERWELRVPESELAILYLE